jgi:DNA repair protein SbcC/Rad50
LAAHAHLLIAGEACPLCGATDHPHPLSETDNNALESKNKEIESAKNLLEQIITWKQTLSEQQIRLDNQLANKSKIETEINTLSEQIKNLKQDLLSHQVDTKETLSTLIQNSDKAIQKREKLLQQIKELRKNLEENLIEYEKEERQIREAEQTLLGLSSKISAKKEEIKDPVFCKPFSKKKKLLSNRPFKKSNRT